MIFEVEAILNHWISDSEERFFLIKWLNYSHDRNTWEREENLLGCKKILSEYLENKGLPGTLLKEIGTDEDESDSQQENENPTNYVDPSVIFKYVKCMRKLKSYNTNIEFTQHLGGKIDIKKQAIYLTLRDQHYYLIANFVNEQLLIDGANQSMNQSTLNSFKRNTGLENLKSLKFNQQRGADHCASSAIAITLELMRLFKNKHQFTENETIQVSGLRLQFLTNRLHKNKSAKLKQGTKHNITDWNKPKCERCNKSFSNRKAAIAHERRCNVSNNK